MIRQELVDKIYQSERISEQEALELFETNDLLALGKLAQFVNNKKNHRNVFFNVNRHINPTNICVLSCKFCAFSRKPGDEGAYAYTIQEMVEKAQIAVDEGATELHMVGGLHPKWNFKHYIEMIRTLHQKFPGTHLKAFTVVELDWMARKDRRSISEILKDLKNAGLGSIPGGGAEIFHPEVRDQICDTKVSAEQWIETHRLAHDMGLRSNCTMLYGHIEKYHHRVDHMRRLRELQDATKGFNVFIPLSFQPYHNDMGITRYTAGIDDLKTIAVARIYLDNFAHVKSYWVMLGQDIAEVGLQFGANDLDGTVKEEKISRMAGGRAGMIMTRSNLEQLIIRSGFHPVERTTLYEPIRLEDTDGGFELEKNQPLDLLDLGLKAFSIKTKFSQNLLRFDSVKESQVVVLRKNLSTPEAQSADWEDFIHQLSTAQNVSRTRSVTISVSEDFLCAPTELFRAISLARCLLEERIALGLDLKSVRPLSPNPILSKPVDGSKKFDFTGPILKFLPLVGFFGLDHFGNLSQREFFLDALVEEFERTGFSIVLEHESDEVVGLKSNVEFKAESVIAIQ